MTDLFKFIADALGGFVQIEDAGEVDRGPNQDQIGRSVVDRLLELADLSVAVTPGWQERPRGRVLLIGGVYRSDGKRSGVDDFGCTETLSGHPSGPKGHAAVCQGRPVLHDQDTPAPGPSGIVGGFGRTPAP